MIRNLRDKKIKNECEYYTNIHIHFHSYVLLDKDKSHVIYLFRYLVIQFLKFFRLESL